FSGIFQDYEKGHTMEFLTLDVKGTAAGIVMALLLLLFGRGYGIIMLLELIWFLVLSAIVTNLGIRKKTKLGLNEKARGYKNVLANGMAPLIIAALYFANSFHQFANPAILIIAFFSSISAITADKFASEIGVLNGFPRSIVTFARLPKGTSGGITSLGILAGLLGSFLVGITYLFVSPNFAVVVLVVVAGFIGNVVDSFFGYFEEKGIGNKYTSNFACGSAGAIAGFAIAILA
ncbi:MAG: DUF92 domain-containing protein, partial [Candidatus Micrarchaeaceae archaeon]